MADHYEVLGVIPNAEAAVIKAAYRALMGIYHPDKNADPAAAERAKLINEAYAVLSDSTKRRAYDDSRKSEERSANSASFEQGRPFAVDPVENSWSIALSFYPTLQAEC